MATKAEMLQALAAESGPITITDLAEKMGAAASRITAQISRMVKNGEVLKDSAGEISISEKGKEVVTIDVI